MRPVLRLLTCLAATTVLACADGLSPTAAPDEDAVAPSLSLGAADAADTSDTTDGKKPKQPKQPKKPKPPCDTLTDTSCAPPCDTLTCPPPPPPPCDTLSDTGCVPPPPPCDTLSETLCVRSSAALANPADRARGVAFVAALFGP